MGFPDKLRVFSTLFVWRAPSKAFNPAAVIPLAAKFTSSTVWKTKFEEMFSTFEGTKTVSYTSRKYYQAKFNYN